MYQEGKALEQLFEKIAEIACVQTPDFEKDILFDYEKAKERLIIRVCNVEENKDMLDKIPHECKEDLAITYHILLTQEDDYSGTVTVNNDLLKNYGITSEQLHKDAIKSSQKLLPPCLSTMQELLFDAMGTEARNLLTIDKPEINDLMLVLRNEGQIHGAAALFYPGVLDKIAEIMKGNFYILPSSVHECILLHDEDTVELNNLKDLVREANKTTVGPNEKLADQVYHYDMNEKMFEIADDYKSRISAKDNDRKISLSERISEGRNMLDNNVQNERQETNIDQSR